LDSQITTNGVCAVSELIKHKLARGERVLVFGVGRMFHHNLIQYVGMQGGFDGLWIDVEHGGLTTRDVEVAAMAGRAHGLDCFVRIPATDYATVTRCFESGATGVMGAQITSAAHAEEFVGWAKFFPRGHRGLNPLGYDGGFGGVPMAEFTERHNRESLVIVQIETPGAVAEIEEIAAIDGVDALFIGPSDLSQAMGVIGDFMHERCIAAIDRVATACRANDKRWGAVTPSPAYAAMLLEKGCTLLSPANDVKMVAAGLAGIREQYPVLW
jgi:2-dehydro-3-deoxyglucarate aldolase/4-hydroxy-2-oxoheptanedioate aldolase